MEGTYDNENMVRFDVTPAASGNARGSGDGWEDSDPWSQGRKARDDAPAEAASPWVASMMAFNEKFGTPAEAASVTPAIVGTPLQDFKDKFGGSAVGGVGFDSRGEDDSAGADNGGVSVKTLIGKFGGSMSVAQPDNVGSTKILPTGADEKGKEDSVEDAIGQPPHSKPVQNSTKGKKKGRKAKKSALEQAEGLELMPDCESEIWEKIEDPKEEEDTGARAPAATTWLGTPEVTISDQCPASSVLGPKENRRKNNIYEPNNNHSDSGSIDEPALCVLRQGRRRIVAADVVGESVVALAPAVREPARAEIPSGELSATTVEEEISDLLESHSDSSFGLEGLVSSHRERMQMAEDEKMSQILDQVRDRVQTIWDRGYRVRLVVEAIQRTGPGDDSDDEDIPVAIDANDLAENVVAGTSGDNGMEGEGEWVKIRNGVNVDTCSAANVMPVNWLPQFQKQAGLSRQRYVGATGKIVNNMGQKVVDWLTNEGQGRSMTFQLAYVNKILACVGMICDANNVAVFMKNGGMIVPEKDIEIRVKPDSPTTAVRRKGNTYSMDAWVRKNKSTGETESSFIRPGATK